MTPARAVVLCGCLFVLALAACAPRHPPPEVAHSVPVLGDKSLRAEDGYVLPLRRWAPAGRPRAVIVALHGFNDYSAAFNGIGGWLAKRGVLTLAFDQRGFGDTAWRGLWHGAPRYAADATLALDLARRRYPGIPLYLMGVSMGGAVALLAAARGARADGLILVAPAVWGGPALNPFYRFALWLAAHSMPGKIVTGQNLDIVPSDNIDMLRALGRDPLVIKKTRIDALYGVVGLMGRAQAAAPRVHMRTLLLYGAHDQIIPAAAVGRLKRRLAGPVRFSEYKNGYHMLLRDLQARKVWRDIAGWVGAGWVGISGKALEDFPDQIADDQQQIEK
jgi:alpha-beta hydrolase superfamily lysophospholipase